MTQIKSNIPKIRFKEFSWEWEEKKINQTNLEVIDWDRWNNYPNWDDFSSEWYCLFMNAKNVTNWWFVFNEKSFITKEKDEQLNKWKLKRWDLVLTTRWTIWNFAYFDDKIKFDNLRINSWMVILRNNNQNLSSNYIYKYFDFSLLKKQISRISFWSAQPQLTVKDIKSLNISFPTLKEQQKISSFLSSVDEKIEKIKEKKKNLLDYKKWVMQKIFNQEIRFKDENWEEFREWEKKKLGEIVTFSKWKWLSKDVITEDWKNKCIHYWELFTKYWPKIKSILSNTNLEWNLIFSEWNEILMPTSDVTPNWLATWSALLEKNVILWWDILIIKWEKLYNLFFAYYISSHKQDIMKLVSWSTVYHLYGSDMKKLKLFLPTLKEQEKIADFLSGIDEKIEKVSDELGKIEEFKKGLLQGMFV